MDCLRYDLGGINKERNPGGYKFKTGISTHEISDIGTFQISDSYLSKLTLTLAERVFKK
jgi:lipid II:glycine glycyltransferase (peptidoglycan interpeptide bridge formation enzyme)